MTEKEFVKKIREVLSEKLSGYTVTSGEYLIYKVIFDNGEYYPKNPANPRKRNYAFETDLLVKENIVPLVVIEVKYIRLYTDQILAYSSKALMHKSIYPYLRYGLLIVGRKNVPTRFFTHNVGFDFAFAMRNFETIELFPSIIEEQIENAKEFLEILKGKKVNSFNIVFNTN